MTLEEFAAQEVVREFELRPGKDGALRPAGHRMAELCAVRGESEGLVLSVVDSALSHPAFAPSTEALGKAFLALLLPDFEVDRSWGQCLSGSDDQEFKANGKTLTVSVKDGQRLFSVGKAKSRFWPFSR